MCSRPWYFFPLRLSPHRACKICRFELHGTNTFAIQGVAVSGPGHRFTASKSYMYAKHHHESYRGGNRKEGRHFALISVKDVHKRMTLGTLATCAETGTKPINSRQIPAMPNPKNCTACTIFPLFGCNVTWTDPGMNTVACPVTRDLSINQGLSSFTTRAQAPFSNAIPTCVEILMRIIIHGLLIGRGFLLRQWRSNVPST